jgi:hypothetical protein
LNTREIKENLKETIANYFEERKKKKETNHHIKTKNLKFDWNFEKYMKKLQLDENP